jgi:carboxypeptidase family protein
MARQVSNSGMRTAVAIATLLFSLVAFGNLAHAARGFPAQPIPTGRLAGRIVDAETGEALSNARVTLTSGDGSTSVVLTDPAGRFGVDVPAGTYRLSVARAGFARADFGARRFGDLGRLLEIAPGTVLDGIGVGLARGAAVTGHVFDARGERSTGMTVTAAWGGDRDRAAIAVSAARVDDLGNYRLGGLPEGTYSILLGGLPPPGLPRGVRIAPPPAEPQLVTIRTGEERSGIDFLLPGPPPLPAAVRSAAGAGGAIRGQVVSGNGAPLVGAQVLLLPPNDIPVSRVNVSDFVSPDEPRPLRMTLADDGGRYEFLGVAQGTYRVGALKRGYTPMAFDERGPTESGEIISLGDREVRGRVDISLPRLSAVTGHITDEHGNPVEGAAVSVLHVHRDGGRRLLVPAEASSMQLTDDQGRFRVYGLLPGRYFVSASVGQLRPLLTLQSRLGSDVPGYATTYFPGTPDSADAHLVSVGISEDVTGIDFSLVRTQTSRISGKALNAAGEPFHGRLGMALRRRAVSATTDTVGAVTYPDGRFEFRNVAPGEYVVQAYGGRANRSTEGEFAAEIVSVNGNGVSSVFLRASSGSSIRGHVTLEGTPLPNPRNIKIATAPVDPDLAPGASALAEAEVRADWTFEMAGINGRRRLRVTSTPSTWALKAILLNGVDITDVSLWFGASDQSLNDVEVVLTHRTTEVSGAVLDARGRAVSDTAVIVFSVDRERWYPASRFVGYAPAKDGTFMFRGLPSGDYFVAAVARAADLDADDLTGGWQEPEFLDSLASRATRLRLTDGQKVELKIATD